MQDLIKSFQDEVRAENYSAALSIGSEVECSLSLDIFSRPQDAESLLSNRPVIDFFCSFLACHILSGDNEGGRYLWRRAPRVIKREEEFIDIWSVARLFLTGDEGGAMGVLRSTIWSDSMASIVVAIIQTTVDKKIAIASKVFTSLSLLDLASYVLLPDLDDVRKVCVNQRWTINDVTSVVTLAVALPQRTQGDLSLLSDLTHYVTYLERKPMIVDLADKKDSGDGLSSVNKNKIIPQHTADSIRPH